MRFAQPFGLWLGLAALGVLLAHLVRRRPRTHVVPFLPLWASLLDERRSGFGGAVVRHLDLLLVMLACAAIALAAAIPYLPGEASTVRDLVLVLDGSVELRAADRERALRRAAAAEVERRAKGARTVLVLVQDEGPVVGPKEPLRAIAAHRAGWLHEDLGDALALAREAARGLRNPELVICTARAADFPGFRARRVGGAVRNAGIATLEVLADPEGGGRIARLGLRGRGPASVLQTTAEGSALAWSGAIEGERVVDVLLPLGGRVTLTVASDRDDFRPDDSVHLVLPERRLPRVLVVAEDEPSLFLAAGLQALEKTGAIAGPLGRTTPEHAAAAAAGHDVLIFDRCAPTVALRNVRALYLAPPPGALPFKVGGWAPAPAIFDPQKDHPLLAGIDLERFPPGRVRAVLGGDIVAKAASGPVLSAGPGWVALGFLPDRTVFAASPDYPLFLRNCIAHLHEALPARTPEFYAVGEPAPAAGIATIEGSPSVRVGQRLVGPPGFWKLEDTTLGVGLLREVDLSAAPQEPDSPPSVGAAGAADRSLATIFVAAAVGLLLIAWWAFWR